MKPSSVVSLLVAAVVVTLMVIAIVRTGSRSPQSAHLPNRDELVTARKQVKLDGDVVLLSDNGSCRVFEVNRVGHRPLEEPSIAGNEQGSRGCLPLDKAPAQSATEPALFGVYYMTLKGAFSAWTGQWEFFPRHGRLWPDQESWFQQMVKAYNHTP